MKAPRLNWEKTHISLPLLDVLCLLDHVLRGAQRTDIGFEDCDRTLSEMIIELNARVFLPKEIVESALWSCTLLHEKKEFKHPNGYSYDYFLKPFKAKWGEFSKARNYFKEVETNGDE